MFQLAGIKGGHPHRFRHTYAVSLLSEGTPLADVATLLGNTPAVVDAHYSAWISTRQEALEARLASMHANDPLAGVPNRKVIKIG